MCEKSGTPSDPEARVVVSDSGEILSPKYAPDIMAPATHPSSKPCALPMPIKAMPIVAMVVHDEPVITLTKAQIRHDDARNTSGCITCKP